jgi:glycosyltransferase involved in cell wall biosynthesis
MKIVIIQEAGRHEKNKNFRESLCLHRALSRIEEVESKVWGLNYPDFNMSFSEIEQWADVIFVIENYTSDWLPINEISNSKKLKIFWSIDSHCVLEQHKQLCRLLNIDILLNSTESYLPNFDGLVKKSYWFPNSYPGELIFPKNIEKTVDIGFCGNVLNRGHVIDSLDKYDIKKDIFVIGDDMVDVINSYKIHLNCNISNDINYRTFETTGCGTFLLTNYTPGLEKLFDIGKEIVVYNDLNDLDNKVEYYLENEEEREKIAKAGYERSKKDHTYFERTKNLIDIIKNNENENENI